MRSKQLSYTRTLVLEDCNTPAPITQNKNTPVFAEVFIVFLLFLFWHFMICSVRDVPALFGGNTSEIVLVYT